VRDFLPLLGAPGSLVAPVHPASEEGHVGQMNPAQGIDGSADDQSKEVCAEESDTERQQAKRRMVRTFKELAAIVGWLLVHCQTPRSLTGGGSGKHAKLHPKNAYQPRMDTDGHGLKT